MKLYICGLREIPNYSWRGITHVVSLIDAEFTDVIQREGGFLPDIVNNADHLFECFYLMPSRLELQFDDVSAPDPWSKEPKSEDVAKILEFGKNIPDEASTLVHCHAGISRSTAAATLLLMQRYPEMSIDEVLNVLLEIRPQAFPNKLILALGAELLDRGREMKKIINDRLRS